MGAGFRTRGTHFTVALMASAALAQGIFAQAPPAGSGPIDFSGYVRVIEGDTVEVYINGHQTGIGIVGIKAPAGNTECGRLAIAFLQELLSSNQVRLEEDPVTPAFDARKRRMFRLVLPDKRSAAIAMAEAGLVDSTGQGIEANDLAAAVGRAHAANPACLGRGAR